MTILALAVPVIVVIILLSQDFRKCSVCNSRLGSKNSCLICGKNVCSKCGENLGDIGWCCPETIHENIAHAFAVEGSVQVYSENYRGKVPPPKQSLMIRTRFYREKSTAEEALRFLAALNGAEIVQRVEFQKEARQNGNYHFTTWKARGVI